MSDATAAEAVAASYQDVRLNQIAVVTESPPQSCEQEAVAITESPSSRTLDIEARHVSYSTTQKLSCSSGTGSSRSQIQILRDVSCVAKSGEILAIAGPSGAGKSTLLEILAGRLRPTDGRLLVSGAPMDVSSFRRMSGFIPQTDALFPLLTVRETLLYSARLRLRLPSSKDYKRRVNDLLAELRLSDVADSRVGSGCGPRGVSGGERRRVSIGVDVIHDPAVLLLDEPTSGLDSASALHVIEMLHVMAKSRSRTIVLSIHQPGYRILQHIHNFLILANGTVLHHGSLPFLHYRLLEAGHQIPPQVNVLEYAIDAISLTKSCVIDNLQPSGDFDLPKSVDRTNPDADEFIPSFANSIPREVMILSQRFSRNIFRTHELFTARTLQALLGGIGLGTIYMHAGLSQSGIAKRLGFFAFTLTYLLSSTVEALPIFLQERKVLIPETSRGAYRVSSYLVANFVVFMPFLLLVASLFSLPVYWLIGLSSSVSAFAFFLFVVWLVLLMANSFVAFFSALVPDYIMGNSLIAGCMGAFFLFSGYFISKEEMPCYWRFMHYISLFKYPLDALLINEYSSLSDSCFISLDQAQLRPIPGPSSTATATSTSPCVLTGHGVLVQLGLRESNKWPNIAIMIGFICTYRVLCYLVLRFKVCRRTR